MANHVSEFINLVQGMDEVHFSADAAVYERAVAAVLDAAGDQQLLDRYRRALTNASAWVLAEEGEDSPGAAPVQTLLDAVETLQHSGARAPDLDVRALAAMVKGRAHTDEVLRALLHGPRAPKDLLDTLQLEPVQLHRVLRWTSAAGLVERSGMGRDVVYSISRMGETALRGTDEPTWVQTAALLLKVTLEGRLRRRPVERVRDDAVQLSGLTAAESERTITVLESALEPSASSALAAALGGAFSPADVILESEPGSRGRATALVSRTLERAGIDDSVVHWWDAAGDAEPREFRKMALSRTVVCVGNPRQGDLGAELVSAFGSLLDFGADTLHLRTRAHRETWRGSGGEDYGVVARFYSPTAGASHFLVGGVGEEGTVGAARTFYERIEAFLDDRPNASFAAVVRCRRGEEPELVGEPYTLHTEDPYASIADPVEDAEGRPEIAQTATPGVLETAAELVAAATHEAIDFVLHREKRARKNPARTRAAEDKDGRGYHLPAGDSTAGRTLPLAARRRELEDDASEPAARPESGWGDPASH